MRLFTHPSRFFLFLAALSGVFILLFARLVHVQLIDGQKYLNRAESNRFYSKPILADRGVFLDRYSDPLMWNEKKYYQVAQPTALFENLTPITRDQALQLMASDSARVQTDNERQYRYPLSTAHVLGYVGKVTAEDLQKNSSLLVNEQVGKTGLEQVYDQQLRGQSGETIFEVNAMGQKLRQVSETPATAGQDMNTTLDPYLSEVAYSALGDKKGAVVITDAQTGEVLAMTSSPAFDLNLLSQNFADKDEEQARKDAVQALFADPNNVFFNRATAGAYPPGSVFKLMTAMSGLEGGQVNASTQVVDAGKITVGTTDFRNWFYRQYGRVEGSLGIVRALTRSNDIFFYKVAEWTGPDAIAAMARTFGFGAATGVGLPGETKGLVPDPEWKIRTKNEKWFLGDTYHYGIGQGDILTSPAQIAQMTQALANHGSLCQLSLVRVSGASGGDERHCRDVGVKPENLNLVLEGMMGACMPGGTAFPFFPYDAQQVKTADPVDTNIDNGAMVCKTGTAEFGAANDKGFRKTHALFTSIVGITPADLVVRDPAVSAAVLSPQEISLRNDWLKKVTGVTQPTSENFPHRLTITVLVESSDANPYPEGSYDAAPVAKHILEWIKGEKLAIAVTNPAKVPPAQVTFGAD